MTQVSRAIAALLEGWQSPKQLADVSGRANPNGLIRDARLEAARRGLVWEECWVRNERGRRFKMHHLAERIEGGTGGDGVAAPTEHPSPGPEHSEMARRVASRSPSPSRWQDSVGVSGAARATGGDQGELWRERDA